MAVMIGSARIDERGKLSGGAAGDQKQGAQPDYKGEVSMQPFYVHSKGWYVLRARAAEKAEKIAVAMRDACNNPNIGYSQSGRYGIIAKGVHTKEKTNADCSSLVRQCVKEATGRDPGDFNTANEATALEQTGLFEGRKAYQPGMTLYNGDILVTRSKGHTVIVTDGMKRGASLKPDGKKPIEEVAKEVIAGKWGNGETRKKALVAAGYSAAEVQAMVNRMSK